MWVFPIHESHEPVDFQKWIQILIQTNDMKWNQLENGNQKFLRSIGQVQSMSCNWRPHIQSPHFHINVMNNQTVWPCSVLSSQIIYRTEQYKWAIEYRFNCLPMSPNHMIGYFICGSPVQSGIFQVPYIECIISGDFVLLFLWRLSWFSQIKLKSGSLYHFSHTSNGYRWAYTEYYWSYLCV